MPLSAYLRDGLTYQRRTVHRHRAVHDDAPEDIRYFHQIGLSVARGFYWQHLDPAVARGLARASTTADQVIDARWQTLGETTNGWRYYTAGGRAVHD